MFKSVCLSRPSGFASVFESVCLDLQVSVQCLRFVCLDLKASVQCLIFTNSLLMHARLVIHVSRLPAGQ